MRRSKPTAVFMAFGTKGDVYPIAAIAAAFASDQDQYQVVFISHSAHENLGGHFRAKNVMYIPVSSPPLVSPLEYYGTREVSFSAHKKEITQKHRHECALIIEDIFGDGPNMEGDLIAINFFALEGWSLAELFQICCIVVAPYVVPYSAPSSFERQFRKELPDLYDYFQEAPTDNLQYFIEYPARELPVFIGLSSVGSMGFLRNPRAFLRVLGTALEMSGSRFILFSGGYKPLEAAIESFTKEASSCSEQTQWTNEGVSLFGGRLFCFSGSVSYNWLFPRCAAAIHHGGSGSTAAALQAGVAQVICPFMLDQFYWAERMFWLGVAPEPLRREHLVPDKDEDFCVKEAANMLVRSLNYAASPEVKARALHISDKLSNEDGVLEAVRLIKEELSCQ